jgi:hypothetical protein
VGRHLTHFRCSWWGLREGEGEGRGGVVRTKRGCRQRWALGRHLAHLEILQLGAQSTYI